jgi:ribose 5-phosphate isomerase RpiB
MILTARQVEQLYQSGGKITLPPGARLTPLAMDWVNEHNVQVEQTAPPPQPEPKVKPAFPPQRSSIGAPREPQSKTLNGTWLWWSDGPCGGAKAAVMTMSRESGFAAIEVPISSRELVATLKHMAEEMKAGRADGGILLVGNGASAMVYANRCPSIRAVLGTCVESVEQGVRLIGANVLVIEHPYKTIQQIKMLLSRFTRGGRRFLSTDVQRDLAELSSCG